MEESRAVDRLIRSVTERESYQASIIRALDGHEVWCVADVACEIVFIAFRANMCRVCNAYGAGGECALSKAVDRMADGHSKIKRRQHLDKMNDEDAVASASEVVCAFVVARTRTESVCDGRRALSASIRNRLGGRSRAHGNLCSCPKMGTKQ